MAPLWVNALQANIHLAEAKERITPSKPFCPDSGERGGKGRGWGGGVEQRPRRRSRNRHHGWSGGSVWRQEFLAIVALSLHVVKAGFTEKLGEASVTISSPLQVTAQREKGGRPELYGVQARGKLDPPPRPTHTLEHSFGAGCPSAWGVRVFTSLYCLCRSPCSLLPVGGQPIRATPTWKPSWS